MATTTQEQLLNVNEVMSMVGVKSRTTLWKWRKLRGFPEPISQYRGHWFKSSIEQWLVEVGAKK